MRIILCGIWALWIGLAAWPACSGSAAEAVRGGPPSIEELLARNAFDSPRISPRGDRIAVIRRVGEIEQVMRIDLPSMATRTLYQTSPQRLPPDYRFGSDGDHEEALRQHITRVEWKTEDVLVVSVDTPTVDEGLLVPVAVHRLVDAQGSKPPIPLNAHKEGAREFVEYSSVLSTVPDDPAHVLLLVKGAPFSRVGGPPNLPVKVYRVAVADGSRTVEEAAGDATIVGYGVDPRGEIVTRTVLGAWSGGVEMQGRASRGAPWKTFFTLRDKTEKELSKYQLFGLSNDKIYVGARPEGAADGDTVVVRAFDLRTQALGPVLWSKAGFDADSIVLKASTGEFMGGCYVDNVTRCEFKDARLSANFRGLYRALDDKRSVSVVSQSDDDSTWILRAEGPDEPGAFLIYDLKTHEMQPLLSSRPDLPASRLGQMRRMAFKARDGVDLFAYVTTPPNLPADARPPLVVMPHGGPEARDAYAYDLLVQFLATRGYVVLQPQFRGSGGFGRMFAEAGYRQWGGRMHQDVMDAVKALQIEGGVDPTRTCIFGASYGGYEALEAAATEPDVFRCAIAMSGVSDLPGFLKWQKAFGRDSTRYQYWLKAIGDPEVDGQRLSAASPLTAAEQWKTPLLLIHGSVDTSVPVEESRQMKRSLDRAHKPVRYVEIRGMGHSPATREDVTAILREVEAFLAKHLGPTAAPSQVAAAH